jgi:hypothetical protein
MGAVDVNRRNHITCVWRSLEMIAVSISLNTLGRDVSKAMTRDYEILTAGSVRWENEEDKRKSREREREREKRKIT